MNTWNYFLSQLEAWFRARKLETTQFYNERHKTAQSPGYLGKQEANMTHSGEC